MVIFVTSSSTSKMDFICFFYRVFGVGGFTSLFRGRVLTIFSWAFSNFLLIVSSFKIVLALVASFPTNLVSSKTEFACVFYDVFGVGGFTSLFRGRVLTIFLWAFSNFLLIVISTNIVLALVANFPTNLVSLNSKSVCRSCVSFGVLKKAAAVLPRLLLWLLPLWTKNSS